ncbi:MAG: cyclic nucleotide-binding domain-containing protein [Thiobacillaceae bacterium]
MTAIVELAGHLVMEETRLRLLQEMPIFGGVTEGILRFLLDLASYVSVTKSGFFFHQGDAADSMFVLEGGKLAVLKTYAGRDYLLRTLERGDCFGEMALLDLLPRSASVLALEDSRAIEISSAALYEIYKKDIEQFVLMQMNMGREISRRLRAADDRLFQARVEADAADGGYIFHSV